MKTIVKNTSLIFLICTGMMLVNYTAGAQSNEKGNVPKTENVKKSAVKVQLNVEGMSCQAGCADGIDKMLKTRKGVVKSKTTYATGSSEIEYDEQLISEKEIVGLIEKKGFKAVVKKENKQK